MQLKLFKMKDYQAKNIIKEYSISQIKSAIKLVKNLNIYELDVDKVMLNSNLVSALECILQTSKLNRRKIWGLDVSMRARGMESHPYHSREELYKKTNVELSLIFLQTEYLEYQEYAHAIGCNAENGSLYQIISNLMKPWR